MMIPMISSSQPFKSTVNNRLNIIITAIMKKSSDSIFESVWTTLYFIPCNSIFDRYFRPVQNTVDHFIIVGHSHTFDVEYDAVGQDIRGDVFYIIRCNIVPAIDQSSADTRPHQSDRPAGRGTEFYILMIARLMDQIDDVIFDGIINLNLISHILYFFNRLQSQDLAVRLLYMLVHVRVQHEAFIFECWRTEVDCQEETIHLSFRQIESPLFGFNRVLCCKNDERLLDMVCFAVDGDLALFHHFKQR